ncbi:hypothetical protein ACO0K3_04800 [Undibacterium sp. Rencai35W]|uniref:hypothetical protein n=1 Tax=Undibacterium sp. Rencai35W TaxID=3413046 RepID=UPI003BF016D5
MTIKGISARIEDPNTGADSTFHVIHFYSVDVRNQLSTALLEGYVSQDAQAAGRNALMHHNVQVPGIPNATAALDWLYAAVVMPAPVSADGASALQNVFAGAVLVHEAD